MKSRSVRAASSKEKLELEKLQIEIHHLKQPYIKRVLGPILIQAWITLIVGVLSVYAIYRTTINDVREKNIDAKTKYYETMLKRGELLMQEAELKEELGEIEAGKQKLVEDSLAIAMRIGRMRDSLSLYQDKITSVSLAVSRLQSGLKKEVSFAPVNLSLSGITKDRSPYSPHTRNLIAILRNSGTDAARLTDSLTVCCSRPGINFISLYILYHGTLKPEYKHRLLSELKEILPGSHCLSPDMEGILTGRDWTTRERYELADVLLDSYDERMPACTKSDILYIISTYGADPEFYFSSVRYSRFWDYLKYNRDLFMSDDTLVSKTGLARNICVFSPQLFSALAVYYLSGQGGTGAELSKRGITETAASLFLLPAKKIEQLNVFLSHNNIFPESASEDHYRAYYRQHRAAVDRWLTGNFDSFRNGKNLFQECVNNKTF